MFNHPISQLEVLKDRVSLIHPSIPSHLSSSRVKFVLEPTPAVTGQEAKQTLNRSPVCCRANMERQTTIQAPIQALVNLTPCMSLECWRKSGYMERIRADSEGTVVVSSTQKGPTFLVESNPGPSCCEAIVRLSSSEFIY